MTAINGLRGTDTLSAGDLVAIYSTTNGGTRKAPASAFVDAIGQSYVDQAEAQADAATSTVSAFQNLVYPGVYAVDPTTRPNGSAMQDGDRAVVLVGGVPTEKLRVLGAWIVPNVDAVNLALSSGSSLVGFLQAGVGMQARTQQDKDRETFSVTDADGVDISGLTDSTAGLEIAFARGGDIHVPDGDYFIAGAGADSGGVEVTLLESTRIICSAGARFFTDSLDNDFIRFVMPTGGAGLPAEGIDFEWRGGVADQRNQKNSTSVPFSAEYPPANLGASATTDFLSVRGEYDVAGTPHHGINRAVVIGLTTIAGDHWEVAGGDSGVFISGCRMQETYYCRHIGARDLGQYFSSDDTGVLACNVVASGNRYESCFGGVNAKRSCAGVDFVANHFDNCVRALAIEHLAGAGTKRVYMAGNTGSGCGILARLEYVFGGSIEGNHFSDSGALLADGVTAESFAGLEGFMLQGSTKIYTNGNTALGMKAAAAAAYPAGQRFMFTQSYDPGGGAVATTYSTFSRNVSDGYRAQGSDSGDRNAFIENVSLNAVTPTMALSGTNVFEVRVDANNVRIFNVPVQFNDGSAAAPAIARRGQATTGVFFATNKVGISVASTERYAANNLGVAFNGAVPAARPGYGAPTGTATRTTFDTATVTLPQLAERVKALIDDMRTYGLAA